LVASRTTDEFALISPQPDDQAHMDKEALGGKIYSNG
jgi:hypothetical protein